MVLEVLVARWRLSLYPSTLEIGNEIRLGMLITATPPGPISRDVFVARAGSRCARLTSCQEEIDVSPAPEVRRLQP